MAGTVKQCDYRSTPAEFGRALHSAYIELSWAAELGRTDGRGGCGGRLRRRRDYSPFYEVIPLSAAAAVPACERGERSLTSCRVIGPELQIVP